MIPWTLEHFMKVLCGMGTSEESRLYNLLRGASTNSPDFATIQKFFSSGEKVLRRNTFEKCVAQESGKDFGILHDMMTSDAWKEGFKNWDGRYSSSFKLLVRSIQNPEAFNSPKEGVDFMSALLGGFTHLISTILYVESFVYGEIKGQPMRDFPTKLPHQEFWDQLKLWTNEKKAQAFELHAFILYFASIEIDISEWEPEFEIVLPSYFVPSWEGGKVIYPMNTFWRWLRNECDCSTWVNFADQLGTTVAMLSKHRDTATMKHTPSWSKLRGMLKRIDPTRDLLSPFSMRVQFAYSIARIMQEHAHRCVGLATEYSALQQNLWLNSGSGKSPS